MAAKKKRSAPARTRIRVVVRLAQALGAVARARRRDPIVVLCFAAGYYYVVFARLIDARLHGERERVLPRVFARPLELRRGQAMTDRQLVDRLNDLGYARARDGRETGRVRGRWAARCSILPRGGELRGHTVRVVFQKPTRPAVRTASRRHAAEASRSCRAAASSGRNRASG